MALGSGQINAGKIVASISLNQKNVPQVVSQISKNLQQLGAVTNKLSNGFSTLNAEMFRASMVLGGASAAFGMLGKAILQTGYEYDKVMAMMKAVTGGTVEEMERVDGMARKMGASTIYGAREAAKGLLDLSKMGLNAADSMRVLEPAMKLAQSQQEDVATTTNLVVSQLKVFGENAGQAARYANVLAANSSKTAADISKLNIALSYVGPVAAQANISFEELNTALGMIFNSGIQASRAGTDLRYALSRLVAPTKPTIEGLKKLGLTIDQVSPYTHSLSEILTTFANKLKTTENKAGALFDVFDKRAATSMSALLGYIMRDSQAFNKLRDSITGTDEVQRQYAIQLNSWSGQLGLVKSNVEELSLQFTEVMLPTLKLLTSGLQGLVEGFKAMPSGMKSIIGHGTVFAGTMTAITGGTVALAFGVNTLTVLFKNLTAAIGKGTLTAGAFAGWVGGAIAVLGLLSTAIIKVVADTAELKRKHREMLDTVTSLTESYNAEVRALDALKDKFMENADIYGEYGKQVHRVERAIAKLAEVNPDLIKGWDAENRRIIMNNDLLLKNLEERQKLYDEQMKNGKLDSKDINTQFEDFLLNVDSMKDPSDKIKAITDEMNKLAETIGKVNKEMDKTKKELVKAEADNAAVMKAGVASYGGFGTFGVKATSTEPIKEKYEGLKKQFSIFAGQMSVLKETLDNLENTGADAVKPTADELEEASKAAEETKGHILGLVDSLKAFNRELRQANAKALIEKWSVGATDLEKQVDGFRDEYIKAITDVEQRIENFRDKINDKLQLKSEGKKVNMIDLENLQKELNTAEELYVDLQENLSGLRDEQIRTAMEKEVESLTDLHNKTKREKRKFANDAAMIWSDSVDLQIEDEYIAEKEATDELLKLQIEHAKNYANYKKAGWVELADIELKIVEETQGKIDAISTLHEAKRRKLKFEKFLEESRQDEEHYKQMYSWDLAQNAIALKFAKKRHEESKKYYEEGTRERRRFEDEEWAAQEKLATNVAGHVGDAFTEAASRIRDAFTDVNGKIDESAEAVAKMSDYVGSFASAAKDGLGGMIAWVVGNVVQTISDAVTSEIQANNAPTVDRWGKTSEEQKEYIRQLGSMSKATIDLKMGFGDLEQQILGLGSSIDAVNDQVLSAWSNVYSGAEKPYSNEIQNMIQTMRNGGPAGSLPGVTSQFAELLMKNPYRAYQEYDYASNPQNFLKTGTNGQGYYVGDNPTSITGTKEMQEWINKNMPNADPEAIQQFFVDISSALVTTALADYRKLLYDPMKALSSDQQVTYEEYMSGMETMTSRIKYWTGAIDDFAGVTEKDIQARDDFRDLLANPGVALPMFGDFRTLMESQFNIGRQRALDTGDSRLMSDVYGKYRDNILFALDTFTDMTEADRLALQKTLMELGTQMKDDLTSTIEIFTDKLKDAADTISDAFENGTLSFQDAMEKLTVLENSLELLPDELRDSLKESIRETKIDILEGMQKRRDSAAGVVSNIGEESKDLRADLEEIDKDMQDVIKGWDDLKKEREDTIKSFNDEANKIKTDSDERLRVYESERAAILGTFSFGESQNARSKRFAQARAIEEKIMKEIIDTNQKLNDLEVKRTEALQQISDKVTELNIRYQDLMNNRNERELEFLNYLREESLRLDELLGKWYGLEGVMMHNGLEGVTETLSLINADMATMFTSLSELPILVAQRTQESLAQLNEYIASLTPKTMTVQGEIGSTPNPIIPTIEHLSPEEQAKQDLGNAVQGIADAFREFFGGFKLFGDGFSGVVNRPMPFIAGEKGPELVNVTPIADLHKMGSGMNAGGVTNIYINESVDLRGAYGISSLAVAEKVYKQVWAPARRRVVDRYTNMRGRTLR